MPSNGDAPSTSLAVSSKTRLGLSLCGGFVTATALETGVAQVFAETGLMQDLRYISATSAGSFIAVMLGTGRRERVTEMSQFVRDLTPQKIFRRRSMARLGISHGLVIAGAKLEEWERRHHIVGKLPASALRGYLHNPNLHIDAFNDFMLPDEIAKAFDLATIYRELAVSPIEVEVVYTNLRTGETETCSSRMLQKALATGNADEFERAHHEFRAAVYASASANIFFPPWRSADGRLWSDGALIRPDPLGFAYIAPVDKILHMVANTELKEDIKVVTIADAFQRAFDIQQRAFTLSEVRAADEKTRDVKELRTLRKDLRKIIDRYIQDPEALAQIRNAVDERFQRTDFSFREDRPTERIELIPSWDPPVKATLYGGYGEFTQTLPDAIERGRKEALRVLSREKLIVNDS